MAYIKTNAAFEFCSGRSGKIVYYHWDGDTFFRPYRVPRNPRTKAQQERRHLFADAVTTWQTLTIEEKEEWNRIARNSGKKRVNGYNMFIRSFMNDEITAINNNRETNNVETPIISGASLLSLQCPYPGAPAPVHRPSVDAPSVLRIHSVTAGLTAEYGQERSRDDPSAA